MPITGYTPTGPCGTCDICAKAFTHYEGLIACGICQAAHCNACAEAADRRGDYSPDGDFDGESMRDCSSWKACLKCKGIDPA